MPNKSNKNITLDDLAVMMAKGFADMATKRDLDDLRSDFNSLRSDFKKEIDRLDQRLGRLEFKLDELRDMIIHLEEVDILDLQKRVKQLEQELRNFKKQAGFK